MEYELMVSFGKESWVYFITKRNDLGDAATEFFDTLENAGINADNINPQQMVLRTLSGEIVNAVEW